MPDLFTELSLFGFLRCGRRKIQSMDDIDFALDHAVSVLRSSVPNPLLWSGVTATACAEAIERLANDLMGIRLRADSAWSIERLGGLWPG